MIYIGIDTGKNTGYAVWDTQFQSFLEIKTLMIHQALDHVAYLHKAYQGEIVVRIEDARKRKWFGRNISREEEREKLQGVGAVKRDAAIWEDFLTDLGVTFEMVPPKNNMTKMSAETFKSYTKWPKRTSEHARDAAMLVFKY